MLHGNKRVKKSMLKMSWILILICEFCSLMAMPVLKLSFVLHSVVLVFPHLIRQFSCVKQIKTLSQQIEHSMKMQLQERADLGFSQTSHTSFIYEKLSALLHHLLIQSA